MTLLSVSRPTPLSPLSSTFPFVEQMDVFCERKEEKEAYVVRPLNVRFVVLNRFDDYVRTLDKESVYSLTLCSSELSRNTSAARAQMLVNVIPY